MFDLKDKVALISGGARGMGEAEAQLFCQLGAKVVIGDMRDGEGKAAAAKIGEASCAYVHLDVTRPESWQEAVAFVMERFGKLNVLVNNAGIFAGSPLATQSLEEYMRVININQVGTFLGIQAAIAPMREAGGGSIVNVSSLAGLQGSPGPTLAYTASKFAVRGMTRAAAIELGPLGIRVNVLIPGVIDTPMNTENPAVLSAVSDIARRQPIARLGHAIECARMAAFLASDASSYCTGSDFAADGGVLAGQLKSESSYDVPAAS
ncbi:MAG: SDR family oxidoreductase [Sphingomonadaceae bacterium]